MEQIASKLLTQLNIPVSKKYVEELILSHRDFPSILSVADTFERLGVPFLLRKYKKEEIQEVQFPYLLHSPKGSGDLKLIKSEKDLAKNKSDREEWSGIIIKAAPTNSVRDLKNNEIVKKEKQLKAVYLILGFSVAIILSFLLLSSSSFSSINAALLLSSFAGIALGFVLIQKDLGLSNKAVDKFCMAGGESDVDNCDKILTSNGAALFGPLKLTDLVLSFFLFQSVLLFFYFTNVGSTSFLFYAQALSFCSIPFVLFSIYYQKFVAKTFCKLCMVVSSVLAVQVLLSTVYYTQYSLAVGSVAWNELFSMGLLFLTIVSSLLILKSLYSKISELELSQLKLKRFKYSSKLFKEQLLQKAPIDTTPFPYEMKIGSEDASIKIIMASNLYCNPCKNAHAKVKELLSAYPEHVSLSVRLLLSGKDYNVVPTSNRYLLHYWLTNIYNTENESEATEKLLHDWFEMKDLPKFKKLYPIPNEQEMDESEAVDLRHQEWVNNTDIDSTPSFYINGYLLPEDYDIEEIISLVPDLVEHFEEVDLVFADQN